MSDEQCNLSLPLRQSAQWMPLGFLALGHFLADGYCTIIVPLLAYMGDRLGISYARSSLFFAAAAIGASFSQPLWGYLSDRFGGRWLLIGSLMIASMIVGIGMTTNYWLILLLILISSAGTGAYHPVSGALAGKLAEPYRAIGVSLFIAAGMAGVATFPVIVTQIVARSDLIDIWPIMLPAPILSLLLWLSFRGKTVAAHDNVQAHTSSSFSLRAAFGDQTRPIILLFITALMRSVPLAAYQVAVPFMVKQRFANDITISGYILALFTLGLGAGGIVGSILAHRIDERKLLIWSMLLCGPALMCFSFAGGYKVLPAAALAGAALGSTLPLAISMGQRLAPRGSQMFSALMMGLSWGLAGLMAPVLVPMLMPRWGFGYTTACFALALIPALIAAVCLPRKTEVPLR